VSLLGDDGHELGLHRVVDLDLLVAAARVEVDAGLGFIRSLGGDLAVSRLVAAALDEPGGEAAAQELTDAGPL
jgi:hypothetical protein